MRPSNIWDRFDQRPPSAGAVLRTASALRYSRGRRCHHRCLRSADQAGAAWADVQRSGRAFMSLVMPAHQYSQTANGPEPPAHPKRIGDPSPVCYKGSEPWRISMGLKTLIVDDEPIARKVLREELESMAGIEVVGEADNGAAALDLIAGRQPDLVLLDLQMPGMGGFEVIRKIRHGSQMPVIVIVTAYDKYALDAFEAGAIDYLLKPVGQDRLAEAIEKARRITSQEAVEKLARLQEMADPLLPGQRLKKIVGKAGAEYFLLDARLKKIVGKAGAEYFLLDAHEVFAFHADGDIVWITTTRKRYQATQTLKVLEERLKNTSFQRIHRNALVNVDHVRKMSALSSQRWLITLSNEQEFIASKRQAHGIRRLVSW